MQHSDSFGHDVHVVTKQNDASRVKLKAKGGRNRTESCCEDAYVLQICPHVLTASLLTHLLCGCMLFLKDRYRIYSEQEEVGENQ